jgi:hypothetical protein
MLNIDVTTVIPIGMVEYWNIVKMGLDSPQD